MARRSVIVETPEGRYRLYPPGTYARGNSSWWVDWHDERGKRHRLSTWTSDLGIAEQFARNIASGLSNDNARAALLSSPPIHLKAAREIPRTGAEAKIIANWVKPETYVAGHINKARLGEAIISEAIAELPRREAIKLLRRVIRRIVKGESGATFGGRKLPPTPKIEVSAAAAGSAEGQKDTVNATG